MAQVLSVIEPFLPIILAVYLTLGLGYVLRRMDIFRTDISRPILRIVVSYCEPFVLVLIMWNLDLSNFGDILALPALGLGLALLMFLPGWAVARLLRMQGEQRGALICCSMMSNIGTTMGTFVCFLFLGAQGSSMGITYCLYFLPFAVTIMFNIARHYGSGASLSVGGAIREYLSSPLSRNPTLGLIAGVILNLSGVPKFRGFTIALSSGIYIDVAISSLAIGYGVHIGKSLKYVKESLVACALKFLVSPVIGMGLFYLANLFFGFGPDIPRVVLIQASMPVAIWAVVVSTLFNLDRDLANACWASTTTASFVVVVALYFIVPLI